MSKAVISKNEYDNGGAIAIKGFNFQHAVAALIIICNYEKENFSIYLETKDDIEVTYSDNNFFIQAKSNQLTLNGLIKADKHNKSILSKSLSKTSDKSHNYYKIATVEFSEQEQKKLNKKVSQHLFNNNEIYEINAEAKTKLIEALIKQGIEEEASKTKLDNCYIYFTPFSKNSENSYNYLLGFMNKYNINVDGGRGRLLLNELLNLIQQKAEKVINNDNEKECKQINSAYLKSLIKTDQYLTVKDTLVQKLEEQNVINIQSSIQIKEFLLSVGLKHLALKNKVRNFIGTIDTRSDFVEAIKDLLKKVQNGFTEENRNLLLAIIIDLYIDDLIYNQKDFYMIIEKFIIIDYKDKEANEFTFSENANIITAEKNTQGKSCLLKSLFYAMGMGIKKFKPEWHIDSKIFKIYYKHKDEHGYIIRQGDNFWINNKNVRLSIKEYSRWLANTLKINMKLPMVKTLVYEPVYPSALILPYYIDQDTSWSRSIYKDVVLELGCYDSSAIPKKIFEYIFNISNDAIQEKEDELRLAKDEKTKAENQKNALAELKTNFIKSSTVLSFDEDKAKEDIKKYLSYARTIQTKITNLQMKLFPKEKSLDENKLKVAELNELLKNNEETYKSISKRCEYCHSELTREQSLSRFKLKNDKFEIVAMKNDLLIKIEKLEKEIQKILDEKIPLEEHYTELLKIANKKQQEYTLAEYIEEKAKKVNNDNYYQTENNVILKISQQEDIIIDLKKVINALKKEEKENRDLISSEYKDLTASFNMKFPDVDFNRRAFLNFSQITDNSGATDNQEFFGLYMIYTYLLFNHSIIELPFGLDSTLKDELDDYNINKFYKIIEEIVLSNHKQSFVVMLKNKLSLLKNTYNVIELTKPILSKQKFEKLKQEFSIISEE